MLFGRKKRIAELEAQLAALIAASERLAKRAVLIDIQRDGRLNKFVFARNGELHTVETMGLLSDDPAQWRKDLLE